MTTAVPAKTELKVVYGAMALGKKEGIFAAWTPEY